MEDTVGGAALFEPFLKSYYKKFAYKSIDSYEFQSYFLSYFSDCEAVKTIDWETWFNKPGMPVYRPKFDDSLALVCWQLATAWQMVLVRGQALDLAVGLAAALGT